MGDAISHAVLPGVVLAYIFNIPLIIGAFIAGIFCATATGYLSDNCRVKQDTVMGVVFSGMFATGLVLYTGIKIDAQFVRVVGEGCGELQAAPGALLRSHDLLRHVLGHVLGQILDQVLD